MGGYGDDRYLSSAEVYDPSTDTWSPIASMQSIRFALAASTGPDGRIYAIGGYDGNGDVATVEAYDPNTDTWTFVASMNNARSELAATTGADGTIYAIGGEAVYPALAIVEGYTADQSVSDLASAENRPNCSVCSQIPPKVPPRLKLHRRSLSW